MGEIVFAVNARNYVSPATQYRGPREQEYFEGDLQISPGPHVEVCIEKSLACTLPILNFRTHSEIRFRRSLTHIRHDKTDVSVLCFVKRGCVVISGHKGGRSLVESGECTIVRSLQSFLCQHLPDNESVSESLHIVVPTHILRSYVPDSVGSGDVVSFLHGECRVAEQTLNILYQEGESVHRDVAEALARGALAAVGYCMSKSIRQSAPLTLGERRLNDILACIQRDLSNPDLTPAAVASHCGISTRYLCYILRSHQTHFSELLLKSRLEHTKIWLAAEKMRHVSVAQIAYMAGFKSPAHFSRAFKCMMGMPPRDFRESSIPGPPVPKSTRPACVQAAHSA
jgi:AraC family transcriptional activator of tynA and feaB